jgi:hypothetical protein
MAYTQFKKLVCETTLHEDVVSGDDPIVWNRNFCILTVIMVFPFDKRFNINLSKLSTSDNYSLNGKLWLLSHFIT